MLDIQPSVSGHDGKWECSKCHTWITNDKTRCSWCNNPKPDIAQDQQGPSVEERNLTQSLHVAIDKMGFHQKKRTWQFLENNIL